MKIVSSHARLFGHKVSLIKKEKLMSHQQQKRFETKKFNGDFPHSMGDLGL